MDNHLLNWLTAGPVWVKHRILIDLLDQKKDDQKVADLKSQLVKDPDIKMIMDELSQWPGQVIKNHKKADLLIHRLSFLTDIGLDKTIPEFMTILKKVMANQSKEGPFEVMINIPKVFGGTGMDQISWILSNAPVVVAALVKAGLEDNTKVNNAIDYFLTLRQDNGWPCKAAPDLGKFKGPGKKGDPCPFASLNVLKILACSNSHKQSEAAKKGAEAMLNLWEERKNRKPFLFAMGTDFKKLKAPFVWYDILHVVEVLSHFKWVYADERFKEMIDIIKQKKEPDGRYKAESVWMVYKNCDFGQKKEPSRWITFLVYRILKRIAS